MERTEYEYGQLQETVKDAVTELLIENCLISHVASDVHDFEVKGSGYDISICKYYCMAAYLSLKQEEELLKKVKKTLLKTMYNYSVLKAMEGDRQALIDALWNEDCTYFKQVYNLLIIGLNSLDIEPVDKTAAYEISHEFVRINGTVRQLIVDADFEQIKNRVDNI